MSGATSRQGEQRHLSRPGARKATFGRLVAQVMALALGPALAGQATLSVPDGFTVQRVAAPPHIRFPMFGALDDGGRLYITESGGGDLYEELLQQRRTCRVSVLEDRDGDGVYEHIQVYAEPFVPSMGLAWRDGKLYVADPPALVTLEDLDGDGRADRRKVILTGFGHTDNGSLHGLEFGPDGWLYLTMGWPDGYRVPRPDGSWLVGRTGALLRCRADGSEPEALARGFDQLVELVFLPSGEVLGSQTWYQNPSGGVRDSLTHLVPGGLYPQRWMDEEPRPFASGSDALPAVLLLPAVAHSGILLYRGGMFPAEWRGQIFSAQFNTRKVVRHPLRRHGATFQAESHDFLTTADPDFRPADVLEDGDGSLLVIDTGSWYVQHCPTGRLRQTAAPGAIYRVRRTGAIAWPDPRGLALNWAEASTDELARRLSDGRPAVRQRAVEALVKRGQVVVGTMAAVARDMAVPQAATVAAVWVLARVGGAEALRTLREVAPSLAAANQIETACAVARALGLHADKQSAPVLERILSHQEVPLRLAAAEALATCGGPSSTPALLAALARGPDRILEHALIYALHHTARAGDLRAALDHPHSVVQKAALLVLDQAPHRALSPDALLAKLNSTNACLLRAAQFTLRRHPEWATHAVAYVDRQLRSPALDAPGEGALSDLLQAFQQDEAMVSVVARALLAPDDVVGGARKVSLLDFLAHTARAELPAAWQEALGALLRHPLVEVRLEAVRVVGACAMSRWDGTLNELASGSAEEPCVRLEALAALARRQPRLDQDAFTFLSAQLAATNSLARLRAAEVLAVSHPPAALLGNLAEAARTDPSISPTLVLAAARRTGSATGASSSLLAYLIASVDRGWAVTEAELDWVLRSAPESARDQARALVEAVRGQAEQNQALLRQYEPLLADGEASRGRALFFDKASCHTCHRVGDQGRPVGPDLTRIGAIRSGRDILESVLLPSSTFAQGFDTYIAELADGESVTGFLGRETPETVVLRNSSGAEARLPRAQITSLAKSRLSMMPEGLLQALTRAEAADLLAFLQSLK